MMYIGFGGNGTDVEPQLWSYDIAQDYWALLATTKKEGSTTVNRYSSIQKLFYTSYLKVFLICNIVNSNYEGKFHCLSNY